MTTTTNLIIPKKAKLYKEFALAQDLTDKKIYCNIKESTATDTYLFQLTEANNGIVIVNSTNGDIALSIDADDLDITAKVGVYNIWEETESALDTDDKRLIEGKINFTEGV